MKENLWLRLIPGLAVVYAVFQWSAETLGSDRGQAGVIGGNTIWAPAIVHFIAQGAIKILTLSGESANAFPFYWMTICALIPMCIYCIPNTTISDAVVEYSREGSCRGFSHSAFRALAKFTQSILINSPQ